MSLPPPTDAALLRAFALERSEQAFRTLVERHQGMVFGAARRKLGNEAAAADVAQAVFAALAAKAAWLSGRQNIGGWLYKATLMESARRQRDDARRTKRERLYAEDMNTTGHPDAPDPIQRAIPVLDDALSDLGSADREAIMLRYFRGLSLRETGTALGTTEEAARKRVSRALEKLASCFSRRGMAVPAAVLAATILPKAGSAAPAAFAVQTAATAASSATTGAGGALYLKWLGLSQAQVAAACLVATAVPITWQAQRISTLRAENTALSSQLADSSAHPTPLPAPPAPTLASANTPPENATPPPPKDEGDPRSGDRRKHRGGDLWEIQRKQDREARVLALNEELGLSPVQHAAIAAAMERADAARAALFEAARVKGEPVDAAALAAVREERENSIVDQLDDEQRAGYGQFVASERQNRQEIFANRMLTEVQSALHLSADQKDRLFSLFAAQAATSDDGAAPARPGEAMSDEHLEELQTVLTEEQFALWKQRIETWSQFFRPPGRPVTP